MTPLQLYSIRSHHDISTLLQLACLKHTGQYLPLNCSNSTAWTYTEELIPVEFADGDPVSYTAKYRGKFNPYADNLLSNPFKSISDTHPIQHKIMRAVLHAELGEAFIRKVSINDIIRALTNSNHESGLTVEEREALIWARGKIIQQSESLREADHNFYNTIADDNCARGSLPYRHQTQLQICLSMLSLFNPRLKTVLEKLNAEEKPITKKIQKILKFWEKAGKPQTQYENGAHVVVYPPTPQSQRQSRSDPICVYLKRDLSYGTLITRMPQSSRWAKRDTLGDKSIQDITTQAGHPMVKKNTWYPWFIFYSTYNQTDENQWGSPSRFKDAHDQRSSTKTNWWEFIKKESGIYIPEDKSKHEQRLIQSILSQ